MQQIQTILNFISHKYFKFSFVAGLYILWIIWIQNFWLLIGLAFIYDLYISKKVNWAFWKKKDIKGKRNKVLVEWLDALIFALIAVAFINIFFFQNYKIPTPSMEKSLLVGDHLFVSKLAFGPKLPNTPLSFPLAQHTLPLTKSTKSYLEWIKLPYKRIAGLTSIKNDDVVVFNFPVGDTVVIEMQESSYYAIVRSYTLEFKRRDNINGLAQKSNEEYYQQAREFVLDQFEIVVRPVDKRDNYIKRCIAIPGDLLEIINQQVYINGSPQKNIKQLQYSYLVKTNGTRINPRSLERLNISGDDVISRSNAEYIIPLTEENISKLEQFSNVTSIEIMDKPVGEYSSDIFPHDPAYAWNQDNFGPLKIPAKGETIMLSQENLPLYERVIDVYENNELELRGEKIFINGEESTDYTFKMDYYFMMGDNRHNSADSRFWGFVPEDHIVGKPKFVWLSIDKNQKFLKKIRWKRMFTRIN